MVVSRALILLDYRVEWVSHVVRDRRVD